jgi:hypothetical protein
VGLRTYTVIRSSDGLGFGRGDYRDEFVASEADMAGPKLVDLVDNFWAELYIAAGAVPSAIGKIRCPGAGEMGRSGVRGMLGF